jgi:putative transposase
MARRPRHLLAGGIQHVINRGALRTPLFADEVGCRLFLRVLRDALDRHPVDLLAWCVMPNHWHLLLRPRTAEALPRFVRWLTLAHSQRWQALHDRRGYGTLYQGRYRSAAVEGDDHLLAVLRYIERNPVRAGLVGSAAAWPWSSARERLGNPGGWLAPLPVPLPAGWLAHLDAPQSPAEVEAVRRSIAGRRRAVQAVASASEPH